MEEVLKSDNKPCAIKDILKSLKNGIYLNGKYYSNISLHYSPLIEEYFITDNNNKYLIGVGDLENEINKIEIIR